MRYIKSVPKDMYLYVKYCCALYDYRVHYIRSHSDDRASRYIAINQLIEQAAIAVDGYLYPYLIDNCCRGLAYEYMDCPCSRSVFYNLRRSFFKSLSVIL